MCEIDVSELLKQNKKFYKLTNKEELHFGLEYHSGKIVDPLPFDPNGECSKGGMYFFEQSQLLYFPLYVNCEWWIREVILLPESRVYKEEDKYKTDIFFLKERKRFDGDLSDYITKSMCLKAIKKCGNDLELVPIHLITKEMCLESIKYNVQNLKHVPDEFKTREMCLERIEKGGGALQFIPSRLMSEEICSIAINIWVYDLEFVPKKLKTKKMCIEAFKQSHYLVRFVPNRFLTNEMLLFEKTRI